MKYRIMKYDGRCIIIDEDGDFGTFKKITPNLETNELPIDAIIAESCPIDSDCITLNGWGCSSICTHKSAFPMGEKNDELLCGWGELPELRRVVVLSTRNCPLNRENCMTCEHKVIPLIPSCSEMGAILKSHAYMECRATTIKE
jgi:hypothetical protein